MSESRLNHLTIVGLGPGDPGTRTVATQQALDAATTIILRTRIHPGLDDLSTDPRVSTCDDLYEGAAKFDDLYDAIAQRVRDAARGAKPGQVVYAVPGHPLFGERSVARVLARSTEDDIDARVLGAVSAVDAAATALGIDPMADELQLLDGTALAATVEEEPFAGGRVSFTPLRPLLVNQVYNGQVATGVKLALSRLLPDDHPITIVRAAGVAGEECIVACPLYELDHRPVDHLTSVWAPALGELDAVRDPRTLQHIVARLRAPGGCPWDRKQTHATLRDAIINEAYEVVDAIDADDEENLAEELGDLFLTVAMHAQLAEENGTFTLEDVYEGITRKIVRRHPHVFGDVTADDPDAVVQTWNQVKAAEKAARPAPKRPKPADGQPYSMPALVRASRVLSKQSYSDTSIDAIKPDSGDMLLAAVARVVAAGDDPESVLRAALARHVDRQQTSLAREEEKGRT
jgi:tetrapyrrole methylase family protein/MazG family protein